MRRKLLYCTLICGLVGLGVTSTSWQRPHQTPATVKEHQSSSHKQVAARPMPVMSLTPSQPVRLSIGKIALDAPVQGVGVNTSGEMVAPSDAHSVSWYRSGYLPGSLGNAVLAAHYMHTSGPGAFYYLNKLTTGDTITLTTETSIQHYAVTGSKVYPPENAPGADIFGKSESANLNLVTCSGEWDAIAKHYRNRLVVFSHFTGEEHL